MVGAAVERKRPMTKEDIQKMNLKKKTRKRTRKFEIDGVTVTTTTSKVIYRCAVICYKQKTTWVYKHKMSFRWEKIEKQTRRKKNVENSAER